MAKKSKRYQEAAKLIEKGKAYSIEEAVALVKETSKVKFDAAVDVAFRLGVDPRQADQQLRGALVLPNGTGKSKKVLVVTEGPKLKKLKMLELMLLVVKKFQKTSKKDGQILK